MTYIQKIKQLLVETAPLGTRGIDVERTEDLPGAEVIFIGPYWDRPVAVSLDYRDACKATHDSLKGWWDIKIQFLREFDNYNKSAEEYQKSLEWLEFGVRDICLNGIDALMSEEDSPIYKLESFRIGEATSGGHFTCAGWHMDGPGARAAMERGKSMGLPPVLEPIDRTKHPRGDPAFFNEWAENICRYALPLHDTPKVTYDPTVQKVNISLAEPSCNCPNLSWGHEVNCEWKKWKD